MSRLLIRAFGVRMESTGWCSYRGSIEGEGIEFISFLPSATDGVEHIAERVVSRMKIKMDNQDRFDGQRSFQIAFSYTPPYDSILEEGRRGRAFLLDLAQQELLESRISEAYEMALQEPLLLRR